MSKQKFEKGDVVEVTSKQGHFAPIGAVGVITRKDWGQSYVVDFGEQRDIKNMFTQIIDENYLKLKNNKVEIVGKQTSTQSQTSKLTNMNITRQQMKDAVETVANFIMKRDGNITTLFLKNELRVQYPTTLWNQYRTGTVDGVSDLFHELVRDGKFKTIKDNGTYQTYAPVDYNIKATNQLTKALKKASAATPKVKVSKKAATVKLPKGKTISRTKALDLMKNSKGRFFTVQFVKKDNTDRTMNCQYLKDQENSHLGLVKVREAGKMKSTPNDCTRNVNLQTLKSIRILGETYSIR